ncbi:MAG: OadG family protein [Eubacteriales bacterium]|nr:OadG family protein [Eubacteriales bacterium]
MMYTRIMMLSAEMVTSIDRSVPLGERLSMGLKTLLLGMIIVMLVLAFLWGLLELFKYVFYDMPNIKAKIVAESVNKKNEPVEASAESAVSSSTGSIDITDTVELNDDEIIAAITAAITAYREIEPTGYTGGFRVVSFKKSKATRR